ncbi:DinB family protein [Parapedobacter lycopersici]|uniref:DinB family protein n=1 Tax=Parapedobacter lycopersici TaxID=1864939 RepID=UPI00214D628B|nr:DinB family protein [Parapedobacter lycopersici]
MTAQHITADTVFTPAQALDHWQGHRSLTRRVIEAFPEDKLFSHSIGGMRTFAELAMELNRMAATGAHGIATTEWKELPALVGTDGPDTAPITKQGILELWDWSTAYINTVWTRLRPGRFQETDIAFGQWEGQLWWHLCYFIDNEVHHRGQGYVYLRDLGIEPPPFWDR